METRGREPLSFAVRYREPDVNPATARLVMVTWVLGLLAAITIVLAGR